LKGAAARDFRKKARREARKTNPNASVTFIDPPSSETSSSSTTTDALPPAEKPASKFPSLNALVKKEEAAKIAAKEKESAAAWQAKIDERETAKFLATQPSEDEKKSYVALDCEMVGVGAGGKKSALARVSIVDYDGNELMDKHVEVMERVTDFRTFVSGVRAADLKGKGEVGMVTLKAAQEEVFAILKGRVLVGHALSNDFKALMMDHPKHMVRDTARYAPFMRKGGRNGGKLKPRKLRDLVKEILKVEDFQKQGMSHDSTKDAAMTMELYKVVRGDWERDAVAKSKKAEKQRRKGGPAGEKSWKSEQGVVAGMVEGGSDEEGMEDGGEADDAFDLSD